MKIDETIEEITQTKEAMEVSCAMRASRNGDMKYPKELEALDMAIEALKFQQECQANAQKCIERIKDMSGVQYDCDKCGAGWEVTDCIYTKNAIEIINEEMGWNNDI